MKKRDQRSLDIEQVDSLLMDVQAFLDHPRANEIIECGWFHDGDVPIPSVALLQFLAIHVLWGLGNLEYASIAATHQGDAPMRYLIANLKEMDPKNLKQSIQDATARRKILGLTGVKLEQSHWAATIGELSSDYALIISQGKRRLVRSLLESFTLRAIFLNESAQVEGLAEFLRADRDNSFQPSATQIIALQVVRWKGYLAEKLVREPTKTELKTFLLDVYPDLSESSATWTAVWQLIPSPRTISRSRRMDELLITKLAREAKNTMEPRLPKISSCRKLPNSDSDEDLQK